MSRVPDRHIVRRVDLDEYRRASHAIWEAMAPGWDARHEYLELATRPVTERILEGLRPLPGETILELAAGTGVLGLAIAAALRGQGRVIVSDFSASMVEAARRRGAELGLEGVEYRVLDGERLDLPEASVDGVACRFGFMLMADPAAALAEARRVLRPGGRIACAVVGPPEGNPWASLPGRVLSEAGHLPPPSPGAPGIHALADPERLRGLLVGAGFAEPRIDEVSAAWTFSDDEDFWDFLERMAGPFAAVFRRLDAGENARLRAELSRRLEAYAGNEGITLPALSLVASATVAPKGP